MRLHLFNRHAPRRPRLEAGRRHRPALEDLESRTVMSAATGAAPAAVPAQVSSQSSLASQIHVSVPLSLTRESLTSITSDAITGVLAAAGTLKGKLLDHSFATPVTVTITPPATADDVPVLHLKLNPVQLNLPGLKVKTSAIRLDITARPGPDNLLGNQLGGLTDLLNDPGTASDPSSALPRLNNLLNNPTLIGGLNTLVGRATSQATNPTVTGPTTNVLKLSIRPADLNRLGLEVALDNGSDGPVTVGITAAEGSGKLLGKLVGKLFDSVAQLLGSPGSPKGAITSKINNILGIIRKA